MKNNKNKLDKIFLIITSVQTILMAVLFILQVCRIYFRDLEVGEQIYTRQICVEYIKQILVVIIIWIILIAASGIYFTLNNGYKLKRSKATNIVKLNALLAMAPDFTNPELNNEYQIIKKENKKRKIARIINIAIISICAIMGLSYLLNQNHFDAEAALNPQIIDMWVYLLPWCLISLISFVICTVYEELSAKKTIEIVKEIIKHDGKNNHINLKNNDKKINIIRGIVLTIAVALIIVGVFSGGAKNVLLKAIVICTECIGLG